MTKHVLLIAMLAAAPFACVKTNPALCCTDEANCASLGISDDHMCSDGLVCEGNQCIAETCASSTDCNAAQPFCTSSQLCEATCDANTECPGFGGSADETICSNGACVQCVMNSDCSGGTPVCDTSTNACVQCGSNSDCNATDPVCSNNVCVGCGSDSDCSSGVCEGSDGQCLDSTDIVYLSTTGSDSGSCTMSSPCATIGYAVMQTSNSRSTLSFGSGTYQKQAPFSFGVGTTAAMQLDIHGHNAVLNGSYGDNYLYEIGLNTTIRDLTINAANSGVALDLNFAGAMYELDNVTLTNAGYGVLVDGSLAANNIEIASCGTGIADGGLVTINQAIIHDTSGAITVGLFNGQVYEQATLQATNVMVYNVTDGPALDIENGIGTVNFSTIYNAQAAAGSAAAGANCVTAGVVFHSSIVWTPGPQPAQTGCVFATSIVGPSGAPTTGAMNVDPQFADPTSNNYRLTPGSPAVDQIDSGPPVDFEGVVRPQGARYDIGASEYKP
jgi:hypothetical protein